MVEKPALDDAFGLRIGSEYATLAHADGEGIQPVETAHGQTIPTRMTVHDDSVDVGRAAGEDAVTFDAPFDGLLSETDSDGSLWITQFLRSARSQWGLDDGLPVAVSIPGAYDRSDADRLLTAVANAGFNPLGVVREPLGSVYAADMHRKTTGTAVFGRLGHYWVDVAVVTATPDGPKTETVARKSLADFGLNTVERTVEKTDGSETTRGEALEGFEREFATELRNLADRAGIEPHAVDRVLLAGPGAAERALRTPFDGVFAVTPERRSNTPLDAPFSKGAAIAGRLFGTDVDSIDSTLERMLAVETLGGRGRELTPVQARRGNPGKISLRTVEDDQTWGSIRIVSRHRAGRDTKNVVDLRVEGIPTVPAGDGLVRIELSPQDTVPSEIDVQAAFERDDTFRDLSVKRVNEIGKVDPWFGTEDYHSVPKQDRDTLDPVRTENPEAISEISTETVVARLLSVRDELVTAGDSGQTLSADDLDVRVRKMDIAFQRAGVEIIDPEPGTPVDDRAHRVERLSQSQEPTDTVVETVATGYRVEGVVEQPARVVVSRGSPETEDDEG